METLQPTRSDFQLSTQEQIKSHRSIRKYKKKEIPDSVLLNVLNAAVRASSSGNMQAYSIIVTRDQEFKQKLYAPHFEQSMVLEAPVLVTFCADFNRMKKWLKLSEAPQNFDNLMSFMIATIDAVLASQNAALAAESEGLGLCYMGTTLASCREIAKILECPPGVVPVVGYSLGYPDEKPQVRDRLPLDGLVHFEKYQDYGEADILKIYEERESKGFARYMDIPELREKVIESGVENLAQIYTKLKYTRESHLDYSQNVLLCLLEQGFLSQEEMQNFKNAIV